MEDFLVTLGKGGAGIRVALLCFSGLLLAALVTANWLAWIFNWGRFKRPAVALGKPDQTRLSYVLADAAVRLVNDFRHLLALLLVVIFGCTLGWVLYTSKTPEHMWEGLKTVTATLGGIVASIIGYYFGEARGTPASKGAPPPASREEPVQLPPPPAPDGTVVDDIVPVKRPEPEASPKSHEEEPAPK